MYIVTASYPQDILLNVKNSLKKSFKGKTGQGQKKTIIINYVNLALNTAGSKPTETYNKIF